MTSGRPFDGVAQSQQKAQKLAKPLVTIGDLDEMVQHLKDSLDCSMRYSAEWYRVDTSGWMGDEQPEGEDFAERGYCRCKDEIVRYLTEGAG